MQNNNNTDNVNNNNDGNDNDNYEEVKGKAFTSEEDREICVSWKRVSEDPAMGNNYKGDVFWAAITIDFNQTKHFERGLRGCASLKQRWAIFSPKVNKFVGAVSVIEKRNQSGANKEKKVI